MNRKALLIFVSQYDDRRIEALLSPPTDVQRMEVLLKREDIGPFEVEVLEDPTLVDVRNTIADFYHGTGEDDTLFLYFAGHGIRGQDGELYFPLRLTNIENYEGGSLDSEFLFKHLARSTSKGKLVVLDCCRSGVATESGEYISRDIEIDHGLIDEKIKKSESSGTYVLAACKGGQSAFEKKLKDGSKHSIYTKLFCDGIESGQAGAQSKFVTVHGIHEYILGNRAAGDPLSEPQISMSNQGRPLEFCKNPKPLRPLPKELKEAAKDGSELEKRGAIEQLKEIIFGSDNHQAKLAEDFLRERLRRDDTEIGYETHIKIRENILEVLQNLESRNDDIGLENGVNKWGRRAVSVLRGFLSASVILTTRLFVVVGGIVVLATIIAAALWYLTPLEQWLLDNSNTFNRIFGDGIS